jgi:purine-binding chemotaxis protein CheW
MFRDGVERLLVFRVGDERFGVSLGAVREVIDSPDVRRLPDATASLLGVATVRGELVPLYDARVLLDVETASVAPGAALIFAIAERRIALAIDDVFDPVLAEEHELRPMPGVGGGARGAADAIVCGLIRRDAELIAVLDDTVLFDTILAAASGTAGGEL